MAFGACARRCLLYAGSLARIRTLRALKREEKLPNTHGCSQ